MVDAILTTKNSKLSSTVTKVSLAGMTRDGLKTEVGGARVAE